MNSRWTRRRFVGAAAKTSAVIVVPAWTLGCSRDPEPADQHTVENAAADDSRVLERVAYLLFPFPAVGPDPYRRVAAAIEAAAEADPDTAALVSGGLAAMANAAGQSWLDIDEPGQIAILKSIEGEPFFNFVIGTTKAQLFTDRTIWSHIGFDPNAPLNDIDWLGDD
jgi:hypothetical protein